MKRNLFWFQAIFLLPKLNARLSSTDEIGMKIYAKSAHLYDKTNLHIISVKQ